MCCWWFAAVMSLLLFTSHMSQWGLTFNSDWINEQKFMSVFNLYLIISGGVWNRSIYCGLMHRGESGTTSSAPETPLWGFMRRGAFPCSGVCHRRVTPSFVSFCSGAQLLFVCHFESLWAAAWSLCFPQNLKDTLPFVVQCFHLLVYLCLCQGKLIHMY